MTTAGVIEGEKVVLEGPCIWVISWGMDVLHEEMKNMDDAALMTIHPIQSKQERIYSRIL